MTAKTYPPCSIDLSPQRGPDFPLTLLFDGSCPICALEMGKLGARDTEHRLVLVDIAQPGFDPAPYRVSLAAMMALIHAARPDGTLIIGVPALRLAYQAVGLGAWVAPTQWPVLSPLADRFYRWFARHRQRISRVFAPLITHIAACRALERSQACASGSCTAVKPSTLVERNTP